MAVSAATPRFRWYRSLYFRIGIVFVAFVVGLPLVQGLFFSLFGGPPPLRGRPNTVAALVAADVAAALADDRDLDLDAYLKRQYPRSQPIYAVMAGGAIASNRSAPLDEGLRRGALARLRGESEGAAVERGPRLPFATAPIRVGDAPVGIVVLPPAPPPPRPLVRELQRLTSLPGTALLVLLTVIAAAVIFEPTRRRMAALRQAARRLGDGDLTARAPVAGEDEVAGLASTFNRMADDLAAREEALRRSDRLRSQMLADVSHELKTPLAAMRGYVETLHRADVPLDEETRERYFQIVERETDRLDRIVKDLLDLARIENGAAALDIRVFAVGRLLAHVVERHEREARERRVDVAVQVDEAADQMVADPHRVEQLIENLFANALRHVPDGGRVELGARVEGRDYVLTVADAGTGIPPEHLLYVFERFYKGDAARSGGGSGLGLSISRAIVEGHGGTIGVESRPGRTVFTARFPLDAAARGAAAQSASTNL